MHKTGVFNAHLYVNIGVDMLVFGYLCVYVIVCVCVCVFAVNVCVCVFTCVFLCTDISAALCTQFACLSLFQCMYVNIVCA